jgi:site-specific DNA recombinase
VYKIFESRGVDFVSLQENFDTSTAIGRAILRVILVFAQLEREQTAERTKDVMAFRAQQGLYNGGYPIVGYDIDYTSKTLIPCEAEIPVAREMFTAYVETASLALAAKVLNEKGYRTKTWIARNGKRFPAMKFTKSNLSRALRNPLYIGKIAFKGKTYDGKHPGIIDTDIFSVVQTMLDSNNISKTAYRAGGNKFLLRGLIQCASCHSMMTPSFALSKGKKYFYYRCTVSNDSSKKQCRVGSVSAKQIENLVVDQLKHLGENPVIIESVTAQALSEQREQVNTIAAKKKTLQDKLSQIGRQAKNLVAVLAETGREGQQTKHILQELKELQDQEVQLSNEIESTALTMNQMEGRIVSSEVIRDNLKMFKDVYAQLTQEEKYDLLHLLLKKIVYYEDREADHNGKKKGKIKMDLWELPPIDPSYLNPANGFAESRFWLPGQDSNLQHPG